MVNQSASYPLLGDHAKLSSFFLNITIYSQDTLHLYYKSNLLGGLMSLFGLDCARLVSDK